MPPQLASENVSAPCSTPASSVSLVRRLLHAISIYALANFAIRAFNFALLPLYTRFLSPADYGIIALAETVAAVVAAVLGLALDATVRRFYFLYDRDAAELRKCLGSILGFSFLVFLLSTPLLLWWGPWLLRQADPRFEVPFYPFVALAIGAAILMQVLQYQLGILQAQGRPVTYALLSGASIAGAAAICIVLVVVERKGAAGMLIGKLAAAALLAVFVLGSMRRWLTFTIHWRFVREALHYSLPLLPHSLFALALVVADRFILEHYRSLTEVGWYSVAYTVGMVMFLVASSVGLGWQPMFFQLAKAGEKNLTSITAISDMLVLAFAAIAGVGMAVAPMAMKLLDARFAAAAGVVPWIIAAYLFHALFGIFHFSAAHLRRTGSILLASALACSANLLLNLLWIPRWGMYGAAYATLTGYAIEAAVMFLCIYRARFAPYTVNVLMGAIVSVVLVLVAVEAGRLPLTVRALLITASIAILALLAGQRWRTTHNTPLGLQILDDECVIP